MEKGKEKKGKPDKGKERIPPHIEAMELSPLPGKQVSVPELSARTKKKKRDFAQESLGRIDLPTGRFNPIKDLDHPTVVKEPKG